MRIKTQAKPKAHQSMDETPRISIVDDDASVRRALDRLCRSAGYKVDSFESAEAFLDSDADDAKCLILDVHLPGKSGLELQSELGRLGKRVPIVFITAFDDEQTRARALEAGAIEFLRKPLDTEQLLDLIQRVLG
jgi:FixJ family two-component response regulator